MDADADGVHDDDDEAKAAPADALDPSPRRCPTPAAGAPRPRASSARGSALAAGAAGIGAGGANGAAAGQGLPRHAHVELLRSQNAGLRGVITKVERKHEKMKRDYRNCQRELRVLRGRLRSSLLPRLPTLADEPVRPHRVPSCPHRCSRRRLDCCAVCLLAGICAARRSLLLGC